MNTNSIFATYKLNKEITLSNRILMAPLTRCFADDNLVPTQFIAEYYARRADVGLIVSEATIIDPLGQGYANTPGIFNKAQIKGWRITTKAVHKKGGKIFCQLWHTGRVAHSYFTGQQPLAPSAIPWHGKVPRSKDLEYETPKALTTKEVKKIVKKYVKAAKNSIKAGFDGVEIHAANGYLIDQFLRQESNQRADKYGGPAKNHARFALQIVKGISKAIGKERTAIRISPQAYVHVEYRKNDEKTYKYLLKKLNKLTICYVHLGVFSDHYKFDYLDGGKASEFIRKHYQGTFVSCGGYTPATANAEIAENKADLIAIGRPLIANPDYIEKIKQGQELQEYNANKLGELY
ncbi:MAG: alkene reductase [Proteobacteria bacterium]|nr:alkene reductase [Pseudomonadota bacterium]